MAIDRGPWNALVDDDGSNLIGSLWNKAAIQTVLLDPIDAEIAAAVGGIVVPPGTDTLVTSTATGTVHDWAPGLIGHTTIVWTGTAALTITGIADGVNGQRVTIKNRGTAVIALAHLAASSAAANRLINLATSAATPIAPDGFATYVYQDGAGWLLLAHEQGAWMTPPFNAAEYGTVGGGSWTVTAGVATYRTRLTGRTIQVNYQIGPTTVAGTPTQLTKSLNGFTIAASCGLLNKSYLAGGSQRVGFVGITAGETWLNFYSTHDLVAWAAGSGVYVIGQLNVEVS